MVKKFPDYEVLLMYMTQADCLKRAATGQQEDGTAYWDGATSLAVSGRIRQRRSSYSKLELWLQINWSQKAPSSDSA